MAHYAVGRLGTVVLHRPRGCADGGGVSAHTERYTDPRTHAVQRVTNTVAHATTSSRQHINTTHTTTQRETQAQTQVQCVTNTCIDKYVYSVERVITTQTPLCSETQAHRHKRSVQCVTNTCTHPNTQALQYITTRDRHRHIDPSTIFYQVGKTQTQT